MDAVVVRFRGRELRQREIAFVRALIAAHPQASRRALSAMLSEAWGWVQPNGQPRAMVCRSLMLALARAGHIALPPVRRRPPNPLARRARPAPVAIDCTPVRGRLADLGPLEVRQVRRTAEEARCNALIEEHHYLGYTQPVGEHLKYLVFAGGRPLACLVWSSAPRHLGARDRFIGWAAPARQRNIRFVVSNTRFLILPWVEVPHLASHLLGRMARVLPGEWERAYGHAVYFAETFVEGGRFRGTCYRAANWIFLGRTCGRGKDDRTHQANRPLKDVWGYPLVKDFRARLSRVA